MTFVDTHCHLNDKKFSDDLIEVISRANSAGVNKMINFGDSIKSSADVVKLAGEHSELFAGIGVHPEEIDDFLENDTINILADLAKKEKVVAIGEIGLDYHWEKDFSRRQVQKEVFIQQLDLARQLHLPVCVHERDAHGDALKILKSEAKDLRGVLHCFSGSLEMAQEVWKLGWLIGVDGPLTFKNSAKLPEIVKVAPSDMILIETDSPYLAPTPYRGQRNEPAYVVEVAKKIAEIRGENLELIAKITTRNAENLYDIHVRK